MSNRPDEAEPYRLALAGEAAELEYQCLIGERAHLDAAYWAYQRYKILGLATVVLGALTTGSALEVVGSFGVSTNGRTALTGMLALLLTISTAILNFLDPKGQRDQHDALGKKLAALRADVRLFRRTLGEDSDARAELDALLTRHASILDGAPALNDRRHRAAKLQLASNVHYRELRTLTGRTT